MTKDELVKALEGSTGGEVVVRNGDSYFMVTGVKDFNDCVSLELGGNFLPNEGGGTTPVVEPVSEVNDEANEPVNEGDNLTNE